MLHSEIPEVIRDRLNKNAANVLALEQRIIALEEQVSVCLTFIRDYAEKLAHQANPDFRRRTTFNA